MKVRVQFKDRMENFKLSGLDEGAYEKEIERRVGVQIGKELVEREVIHLESRLSDDGFNVISTSLLVFNPVVFFEVCKKHGISLTDGFRRDLNLI